MKQNEITRPVPCLNADGAVAEPGWSRSAMYVYDRAAVRAHPARVKEWDFYQISDSRYTIQATFADISLGGAGSFAIFDRETGEKYEAAAVRLLTFGSMSPGNTDEGDRTLRVTRGGFDMRLDVRGDVRTLTLDSPKLSARIVMQVPQPNEFLMMAVPFRQKNRFYLNKKMNCIPAAGYVRAAGRLIPLGGDAFCVLDWGRGAWPYHETWYWGNGSAYLADGTRFGFELGWGFGEMNDFTENTLFYDGIAHKLGRVSLKKDGWTQPWVFSEEDGRFEMTMTPTYDNYTSSRVLGLVGNRCHQVFGLWSGVVTLDDGKRLEIRDMTAFCECSDNRW